MAGYDNLTEIARPIHVHGAVTDADYERMQRVAMASLRRAFPANKIGDIHDVDDSVRAYVAGGKWIVDCRCGNAPSASPEWNVARCFNCGAVMRDIQWPKERATIELALMQRRSAGERGWYQHESVEDLHRENLRHGVKGVL